MTEEPFNAEERDHYRSLVAMFINNNAETKKRLDGNARMQLASARETLPDANGETLVTFLLSMAFLMSKILTTPLSDVAEMGHAVFQNNITAAASLMGVYSFDDPDDMPEPGPDPPPEPDPLEDIIQRQYLLWAITSNVLSRRLRMRASICGCGL